MCWGDQDNEPWLLDGGACNQPTVNCFSFDLNSYETREDRDPQTSPRCKADTQINGRLYNQRARSSTYSCLEVDAEKGTPAQRGFEPFSW